VYDHREDAVLIKFHYNWNEEDGDYYYIIPLCDTESGRRVPSAPVRESAHLQRREVPVVPQGRRPSLKAVL
jgi:hypothetical protein